MNGSKCNGFPNGMSVSKHKLPVSDRVL